MSVKIRFLCNDQNSSSHKHYKTTQNYIRKQVESMSTLFADLHLSVVLAIRMQRLSGVYSPLLYHGAWAIAMVTIDVPWGDICP